MKKFELSNVPNMSEEELEKLPEEEQKIQVIKQSFSYRLGEAIFARIHNSIKSTVNPLSEDETEFDDLLFTFQIKDNFSSGRSIEEMVKIFSPEINFFLKQINMLKTVEFGEPSNNDEDNIWVHKLCFRFQNVSMLFSTRYEVKSLSTHIRVDMRVRKCKSEVCI